jgi:hypothetical protein
MDGKSLYVAYIPRLVRFQRICNNVSDFHDDFLVVLWQGDSFHKLQKTFTNLYYPHASLVYKYYSICQIYDQQGYFPSMLFMVKFVCDLGLLMTLIISEINICYSKTLLYWNQCHMHCKMSNDMFNSSQM